MYRVIICCPDRHLSFHPSIADVHGVGGGVTLRLRMAQALAALGLQVTLIGNVPRAETRGRVRYIPLDAVPPMYADVLVMSSSGGALDLRPVLDLPLEVRRREVWLHGAAKIGGLDIVGYDGTVAVSNFVRLFAQREVGVPPAKCFVAYPGAAPSSRRWGAPWERRDSRRIVYTSHPVKGFEAARGVLRVLRERDPRFELHIYGGTQLWGTPEEPPPPEPGVVYHGLVGQRRLSRRMLKAGFGFHLQGNPEGLSLALLEGMMAGCIVLASPMGGNAEPIVSGYNGFLIPGDHMASATWQRTAELIMSLVQAPAYADFIRSQARAIPWTWTRMARAWTERWDWTLRGSGQILPDSAGAHCPECGGDWLMLADGLHCLGCGAYEFWWRGASRARRE